MTSARIRHLIPADRTPIENILRGWGNFREDEIVVAMEVLDEAIRRPEQDYHVLCAEFRGRLAGYVCFGRIPLTLHNWDLYWIAVDHRQGRLGVGTLLMEAMEGEVRRQGGRGIFIDTSSLASYAPARGLYEKNGFRVAAQFPDFYRDGDARIVYRKEVTPHVPHPQDL
ncbi:MAG: GNAT family N-acetyltransferase [Thermodesulfobacteriota bacterium]